MHYVISLGLVQDLKSKTPSLKIVPNINTILQLELGYEIATLRAGINSYV